jgi:hypothetical protein
MGGKRLSPEGRLQYPLVGKVLEGSGRSSVGVMMGGEGAEEEEEPLASRAMGMGGGGVLAATEAAAE